MNLKLIYVNISLIFLVFLSVKSTAQDITIEIGPTEIALNQMFTVSVVVKNDRLRSYDDFPDIDGFVKQGTSSSSSTNIINGQISSTQSITQNYAQGTYILRPFKIEVNGKTVDSRGASIQVGPPLQRQQGNPFSYDPFDDFFGRPNQPQEYEDVEADAFFSLSTNKEEVYVGEGLLTTLAFYVSENNRATLQFYEISRQISEILKKIKPENCWEENFNIDKINGKQVTINGKRYTQYLLYQAVFYPLNLEDIVFPSVGLEMIKYKVAKNPSFFGRNRQENYQTFNTKAKKVKVLELPPHPLKDQVSVGNYRLNENISELNLQTGQSFSYNFNIVGEGNISALNNPMVIEDEKFDFYPPNIRQNINRANNRVTGSKSFTYYGIPREPGSYKLGNYFKWIYFNPDQQKYDTLRSELAVSVTGESKRNETIMSNDLGTFYDVIELENNELQSLGENLNQKLIANILIVLMLILTAFVIFKK